MIFILLGVLAASIWFSLTALKYLPFPYIWISLCWIIVFVFSTLKTKNTFYRLIWYSLSLIVLILAAGEIYSAVSIKNRESGPITTGAYNKGYFIIDDLLGYAPLKGKTADSKKYKDEELVYNVTYTISENGLRITPPSEHVDGLNRQCILFFGGSYMFGEGVEDHETIPYIVGQLSGNATYNFAFHGYGPHQMLSAIQHGVVDRTIDCKPDIVIYLTRFDHVARAAGQLSWDNHGPKYVLSREGSLEYEGHFDDNPALINIIKAQIDKSFIYKKFFKNKIRYRKQEVELFLEIVESSRKILVENYADTEFHVIFWDKRPSPETGFHKVFTKIYSDMVKGLKTRDITYHLVSNILPDYSSNQSAYEIGPYDLHPNTLAHRYLSEYIVREIISDAEFQTE